MTSANRGSDQYIVRFPNGLREQVKAMATNNRRSMNAEIIVAIERAVQQQPPKTQNGSVTA